MLKDYKLTRMNIAVPYIRSVGLSVVINIIVDASSSDTHVEEQSDGSRLIWIRIKQEKKRVGGDRYARVHIRTHVSQPAQVVLFY